MSLKDTIEGAAQSLAGWIAVTVAGAVIWIIRRIFTNQKQIEMLQMSLSAQERDRGRDREETRAALTEIKATQHEMAEDIKQIFRSGRP